MSDIMDTTGNTQPWWGIYPSINQFVYQEPRWIVQATCPKCGYCPHCGQSKKAKPPLRGQPEKENT